MAMQPAHTAGNAAGHIPGVAETLLTQTALALTCSTLQGTHFVGALSFGAPTMAS